MGGDPSERTSTPSAVNAPPEAPPSAPESEPVSGEPRISTGNPDLDTILRGGLVSRRPYLVVGPAGTGKTKLVLQFLCEGVRRGEKVLLITLEDPPNEMRINHRALQPELDQVCVFDAIPDVMRYERAPFKDIAAVRSSVPFSEVPPTIRKTAELVSVEVTFSALEQTLKMEMAKRSFTRLAVDSLTALQYFCMKGIDETLGAQTFLRFLSDLRITTLLTVEAPVEEVETAERLLARGEIRLFRWELDGLTVRAIGVEKFRGSAHDVRLHPYRISSRGLDIDLRTTISRDTRRVVEPTGNLLVKGTSEGLSVRPSEVGQILSDVGDLVAVGIDVAPVQAELAEMRAAADAHKGDEVALHLIRARALVSELATLWNPRGAPTEPGASSPEGVRVVRIADQAGALRVGAPPLGVAPPPVAAARTSLDRWASETGTLPLAALAPSMPSEPTPPDGGIAPLPAGSAPNAPAGPSVPSEPSPPAPAEPSAAAPVPAASIPNARDEPAAPSVPTTPNIQPEATPPEPPSPVPAAPAAAPRPLRGPLPRAVSAPPLPGPQEAAPPPDIPSIPRPTAAGVAVAPAPNVAPSRPGARVRARPPLPVVARPPAPAPPVVPPAPVQASPEARPSAAAAALPSAPSAPRTRPPSGRSRSRAGSTAPAAPVGAAIVVTDLAAPATVPPMAGTSQPTAEAARPPTRRRRSKATAADGTTPAPRRRASPRRKAPPVTHADPGTPPPDDHAEPAPAPQPPTAGGANPSAPAPAPEANAAEAP
jgi:KaiC/GvpD/RAD55 family RecA-like ATPase